jgi:Mn-dependent DtxR family transcriptional regulator
LANPSPLQDSVYEYLEMRAYHSWEAVPCWRIAGNIGSSTASVSRALGKLRKRGLVESPIFGRWRLTTKGE